MYYCTTVTLRFLLPLFFASLFILTIGTRLESSDAQVMYETSRALAFERTFALPMDFGLPQIRRGADGRYYSQYDPGLPLLAAPLVYASDALAQRQLWNRYAFAAYMVRWISALSVAGGLSAAYTLAKDIYRRHRLALALALVGGLCTPLWTYGRLFFAEGLLAGCAAGAFLWGYRGRWLLAGAALGLAILTRAAMAIYLLPLLWLMARDKRRRQPLTSAFFQFVLFPIVAAVGLLYHNHLRSGDPFAFGYAGQGFTTPFWEGAFGLLFSPAKSVFLYAPPLALSVYAFPRFRRRQPALAEAILLASAAALLVYGSWWAWHGGWSWGPRFLLPLLPLWLLPLGELVLIAPRPPWLPPLTAVLLLAGFLIALLGVFTDVNRHYARYDVVNYSLEGSPLMGAVRSALAGEFEALGTFQLPRMGWLSLSAVLMPMILMTACIISFALMLYIGKYREADW